MARGSVRCDPGGVNLAGLQIFRNREPGGRFPPRTGGFATGGGGRDREARVGRRRGRRRGGGSAHRGARLQAVGARQLPPEALRDLQRLLAVRRADVAGQRLPPERVRGVLALRQPGAVRAGQPAAERRRAGGPGLGRAVLPEATQDVQPLDQPRPAHRPQLFREDH